MSGAIRNELLAGRAIDFATLFAAIGKSLSKLIDYGMARPANKLRASKESTLKGTQTKSEPSLAGFPY
jgi:hypothetical protein